MDRYKRAIIETISGSGSATQRLYNVGCLVSVAFCLLSALESALVDLPGMPIAANIMFSALLAFFFYLSRVRNRYNASRILGIMTLVFLYTPMIWIYNGGSRGGIPFFIVMFISFLVVLTIEDNDSRRERVASAIVVIAELAVVASLIYLEYSHPEKIIHFSDRRYGYIDMVVGLVIAILGNYIVLKTFVSQHWKDLKKIRAYSRRLEEIALVDSMTGILNHSHAIERLDEEVEKALRYGRSLSLFMFDLDFFKRINDTRGHQLGDDVLVAVAKAMRDCSRNVDISARYGGDEFLIILPETNAESAIVVASRVQSTLRNLSLGPFVSVTISGGVVQCAKGDSAHEMIKRADILLYKAKEEGRDRVIA